PENARAAVAVLTAAGYDVVVPAPLDRGRPLCCGRTFLAEGLVDQARAEARRVLAALAPHIARGAKVVGLEPSCLFTLKDEFLALGLGAECEPLAERALLFEEFVIAERRSGRFKLALKPVAATALLHGHCHQKAFDAMATVEAALKLVPGLAVRTV